MTVTNTAGTNTAIPVDKALPPNGVIYVKSGTGGCGTTEPPSDANYAEPATCGNVYVSGTYTKSMTLAAAANDIIVRPDTSDRHQRRPHQLGGATPCSG